MLISFLFYNFNSPQSNFFSKFVLMSVKLPSSSQTVSWETQNGLSYCKRLIYLDRDSYKMKTKLFVMLP